MQTIENVTEKFDSAGREGNAEAKSAKRINRARATGVRIMGAVSLVGTMAFAGGFRHQDGGVAEKIGGGIEATWNVFTSPFKNSQGNWDMPFFDIPGINFNSDENEVVVSTAQQPSTEDRQKVASNGIIYDPTVGDRFYEQGDYAVCSSSAEIENYDGLRYVADIVLELNPELFGNKAAALNVSYNEFEELNPGVNADAPPSGYGVNLVFPAKCKLQ